jgi:hypothetical protein
MDYSHPILRYPLYLARKAGILGPSLRLSFTL